MAQINEEENIYQEVADNVLESFGIDGNDFIMAQQIHMSNPLFQKKIAAIQVGLENMDTFVAPITKEKTKEVFMYVEDQKFKTMEKIMRMNPTGAEIVLLVEHSRIEDMMFEKFGVEADDFAKCVEHYKLRDDEDIKALLFQNANEMKQPGGQ